MGSTLFDVAAITGPSPLDEGILTTMEICKGKWYSIETTILIYLAFIANNMGGANNPITDDEHVTFLFHWLDATVFCSWSIQMKATADIPLPALLIEG